jgi:hypothetical protein
VKKLIVNNNVNKICFSLLNVREIEQLIVLKPRLERNNAILNYGLCVLCIISYLFDNDIQMKSTKTRTLVGLITVSIKYCPQ